MSLAHTGAFTDHGYLSKQKGRNSTSWLNFEPELFCFALKTTSLTRILTGNWLSCAPAAYVFQTREGLCQSSHCQCHRWSIWSTNTDKQKNRKGIRMHSNREEKRWQPAELGTWEAAVRLVLWLSGSYLQPHLPSWRCCSLRLCDRRQQCVRHGRVQHTGH